MSNAAPFRTLPFFALMLGLLVLAWAAMGGAKGGQAAMPRMFEEGLTFEQATERSLKEGKPIFAVFSATWCAPCQAFKRGALSDPRVEKAVKEGFIPAYVDIDEQKPAARMFKVSGVPAMAVIKGGERIRGAIGMLEAEVVLKFLEEAAVQAGEPLPKSDAHTLRARKKARPNWRARLRSLRSGDVTPQGGDDEQAPLRRIPEAKRFPRRGQRTSG